MYILADTHPSCEGLICRMPEKIRLAICEPPEEHIEEILERVHGVAKIKLCSNISDFANQLYQSMLWNRFPFRILIFEGVQKNTDYILYSCILKIYKNSIEKNHITVHHA